MKQFILAAALAATTMSGAAIAVQTDPAPEPSMPERTTSPDAGTAITRADFLARSAARFDARDANKDGTLSGDELLGRNGQVRPNAQPMTRAAALARAGALFDRLDTNKDGTLDATERQAMRWPSR